MADTGLITAQTGGNDASVGTVDWVNPGGVADEQADPVTAGANFSDNGAPKTSHYLTATNLSLTIPAGAVIDGIEVQISHRSGNTVNFIQNSIKLIVGGSVSGDEKSTADNVLTTTETKTFGGAADKWGLTPTRDQVVASNFGVAISYILPAPPSFKTMYINKVQVKVYYTPNIVGPFPTHLRT